MKKIFVLIFLFYYSFLSANTDAAKFYQQAVLKVKVKKYLEAYFHFSKVIKISPYFTKGHFGIGKLYLYQIFDYRLLVNTVKIINADKKYKDLKIVKILGKSIIKKIKYLKSHRKPVTINDFKDVIIRKAINELKTAIQLDRNYANAYFYLGIAFMFSRAYHEALRQFQQAYHIDKFLIEALYNSATVYEIINEKNQALFFYKKYYYEKYLLDNNLDRKKYPFKLFLFPNVKI